MSVQRTVRPGEDPVCAMRVDPVAARAAGLVLTHEDVDYSFCSATCLADFQVDPAWFLDEAYTPTTM